MADGWDLHAVVSGCTTAPSSSTTATVKDPLPDLASLTFANDDEDTPFSHLGFGIDNSDFEFQGLEEVYWSYNNFVKPRPNYNPACASSISITQQQPHQKTNSSRAGSFLAPPAVRSRRRKNQQTKLVHQMSHEELLADSWAWRKYGQKPIKGSPYPRNYYRCSTSKGCGARKQVEKSPSDPDVYVVSYSGDHTHPRPTHRNSLAGTTRAKFSSRPNATAGASSEPPSTAGASSSSPVSASSLSPGNSLAKTIEILDDDDQDDDEMGETEYDEVVLIPNTLMSEDMLKGFEELRKANSGSTRFDQTRDSSLSPWNFSSAAAGDGGC